MCKRVDVDGSQGFYCGKGIYKFVMGEGKKEFCGGGFELEVLV